MREPRHAVEASPLYRLGRHYTVEEFAALPEDNSLRYELQEGTLLASPVPGMPHAVAVGGLMTQLRTQLPPSLDVLPAVEVHLDALPATVRVPDLVVVTAAAPLSPGHFILAADVLVVVEVLSPESVRTDSVIKLREYADAGIPHVWLVDPGPPVTVAVHGPGVIGVRQEDGVVAVNEPCSLRVELARLTDERFS